MIINKGKNNNNHNNHNDLYPGLSGFFSPVRKELLLRDPATLDVGDRLRRERYLRSFSLEQMASYLGISTSYLGAMERGARPVSKRMMHMFHDRLGISYDYLWEGMSVTGTMISQFVHESSPYETTVRHKLDVLLNVASPDEVMACYNMFHTYLMQKRNEAAERASRELSRPSASDDPSDDRKKDN